MNEIQNSLSLLTVCIITFNHESYIDAALQSVLNQKVNTDFKIIIADDCSKDKTIEKIKTYKNSYPEKIELILRNKTIGAAQNWMELISLPNTKYIAYLEGDDYWIDEFKLQKQLDFLEKNNSYSMCFTNSIIIDDKNNTIDENAVPEEFKRNLTHEDILENNYSIYSGTGMYKNASIVKPFSNIYNSVKNGDYLFYSELTLNGAAAYLDFTTSAYRLHNTGIWNQNNEISKQWIMYSTFKKMYKVFTNKSQRIALKNNLKKIHQNLSWAYLNTSKIEYIKFTILFFFISVRYGVLKNWIKINLSLLR